MEQTLTAQTVFRALYNKGTTLKGWCSENKFNYQTAHNAVTRHVGGEARQPWGPNTRAILIALGKETGLQLIPTDQE